MESVGTHLRYSIGCLGRLLLLLVQTGQMESVGTQLDYSIGCLGRPLLLLVETGQMESKYST